MSFFAEMMKIHGYRAEKFSFPPLSFFPSLRSNSSSTVSRAFDTRRSENSRPFHPSFSLSSHRKETSRLGFSLSLPLSLFLSTSLSPSRLPNIAKRFFARLTFDDASSQACKKRSVRRAHTQTGIHTYTHTMEAGQWIRATVARPDSQNNSRPNVFYADVVENLSSGCAKWSGTEWRRMRNV